MYASINLALIFEMASANARVAIQLELFRCLEYSVCNRVWMYIHRAKSLDAGWTGSSPPPRSPSFTPGGGCGGETVECNTGASIPGTVAPERMSPTMSGAEAFVHRGGVVGFRDPRDAPHLTLRVRLGTAHRIAQRRELSGGVLFHDEARSGRRRLRQRLPRQPAPPPRRPGGCR